MPGVLGQCLKKGDKEHLLTEACERPDKVKGNIRELNVHRSQK